MIKEYAMIAIFLVQNVLEMHPIIAVHAFINYIYHRIILVYLYALITIMQVIFCQN